MPLGLAKDSMLDLAEKANQKEQEEGESSQSKVSYEEGSPDLVLNLATHEIASLEMEEREPATEVKENGEGEQNGVSGAETPTENSQPASSANRQSSVPSQSTPSSISAESVDSGVASSLAQEVVTSPQKATPAPKAMSYGAYAGFQADYSEYERYNDYSSYASTRYEEPFWCCLFPWLQQKSLQDEATLEQAEREALLDDSGATPQPNTNKEEDEVSTGSDMFGEKLSDKDRQAVLARLRLAQPDSNGSDIMDSAPAEESTNQKGLLNGIVSPEPVAHTTGHTTGRKGILKGTGSRKKQDKPAPSSSSQSDAGSRRSLFPQYEVSKKGKNNLKTSFSPMARVLTVKSHKSMDEEEKGSIWWQRSDYEEFRKTGRMITKALLEGGSEIWLATNQSWQLPNKDKQSTLANAYSLAERHAAFKKGNVRAKEEYEEARDKWWHKFGHSRRGLEHIASIDEGRQRQGNVRAAIRSVVDEQRRQIAFHREDPDKLRLVSTQHTSWARDLAMAAGASDADAVRMNFDDESRKSREFYLLKFSRSNQMKSTVTKKASVPAFMKPALTMKVQPSRLDANTVSQLRYRQQSQKKSQSSPSTPAPTQKYPKNGSTESVPIKGDMEGKSSMAKKAAGFAKGEAVGNMSAVLSGMGAMTSETATVGGP